MSKKIFLYSKSANQNFIKKLIADFDILELRDDALIDNNFKNKNVLFFLKNEINIKTKPSFFLENNVLIFYSKKNKKIVDYNYGKAKFLYGPIKVEQFYDAVKNHLLSKTIIFKDIEIIGEKITNLKNNLSCLLTPLEKKILTELVEEKQISRDYFLEEIINIKKNIETKTIESHLTRIRKKLLKIKTSIKISSREDIFYFEN